MNKENIIKIRDIYETHEVVGSNALKNIRVDLEKQEKEILFFDPEKEVEYLKRIDDDKKYIALELELKTAMQELFCIQGGALERVLENGRIKDEKTNVFIDKFMTSNPLDKEAFDKIQKGLNEGNKVVAHFSPINMELGYTMNIVDFWLNSKQNENIKYVRLFVNDDFERLKLIYETFGGKEKIESANDLLTNPLATNDFKMAEIMVNLTQTDKKIETNKNRIDDVVEQIMENFYDNFEKKMFSKKDLINRIFSACYDVVLKGKSLDEVEVNDYLGRNFGDFMFGQILEMKTRKGGGACPGIVATAEFGSSKTMVTYENGSLVYKTIESADGLKFCEGCGYYYSGDKCPICD